MHCSGDDGKRSGCIWGATRSASISQYEDRLHGCDEAGKKWKDDHVEFEMCIVFCASDWQALHAMQAKSGASVGFLRSDPTLHIS